MAAIDNPCYQCKNRKIGCHAVCESHIAWQEKKELARKQRAESKVVLYYHRKGMF